jgi:2'-5' RNA ligase
MRIFLAIALDAEVRKVLEQSCKHLAQSTAVAQWRWTPAANYHVTVVFLGEVPAKGLAAVERAAQGTAVACNQFQCNIADIAAFPDSDHPKCLVAEVESCEPLLNLHRQLVTQLQREGFALQAQPYRPHITVARGNRHHPGALSLFGEYPGIDRKLSVDAVTIYQSSMPPSAANYLPLASFALAAA